MMFYSEIIHLLAALEKKYEEDSLKPAKATVVKVFIDLL
jgi:hypothetical protein